MICELHQCVEHNYVYVWNTNFTIDYREVSRLSIPLPQWGSKASQE